MEKQIYELISNKIVELKKYGIEFPSEKLNSFYNEMINSGLSFEEIEKKINESYEMALEQKKIEILNEKAKNGEYSNFSDIKNTALYVSKSPLAKLVTIYGGSVPYFITDKIPKRIIGDIDLHATMDDMALIREYIKKDSNIKVLIDTLDYSSDDFGIELSINGVDVSIFPTILTEEGKIVRNFEYQPSISKINEKETIFYGLNEENSTINSTIDGIPIKMECPEYIYIQKSIALREKDRIDIEVLNSIVDQDKINFLKQIIKKPNIIQEKVINLNEGNSNINTK